MFSHHPENWQTGRLRLIYSYFGNLPPILSLEISGDLSQVPFGSIVKQLCENTNSFMVIQPNPTKSSYLLPSHLFKFYSLVQLLIPTVKLNGASQPISIEYKMVHGFSQAAFKNLKFQSVPHLGFVLFLAMVLNRSQMLH